MLLVAAGITHSRERAWVGAAYAILSLLIYWATLGEPVLWANLAAIIAIPASVRYYRTTCKGDALIVPALPAMIVGAAVASAWLWVTQWTVARHGSAMLTIAWALLAPCVFAAGLLLRERVYRLGGFLILFLAMGRIFIVDVWRLETIFRILSFLVLGVVLLALGFVYNRFASTIRKWL